RRAAVAHLESGSPSRPPGRHVSSSRRMTASGRRAYLETMAGSAPWRRVDPRIVDLTLALASLLVMVVSAALAATGGADPQQWWGVALLVVEAGAILIRRRHLLAGLLVAGACAAAYGIAPLPDPVAPIGLLVMFGSYVSVASWRRVALAGPVALI